MSLLEVIFSGYGLYGIWAFIAFILIINFYKVISRMEVYNRPIYDRFYLVIMIFLSFGSAVFLLIHSMEFPKETLFIGFVISIPCAAFGMHATYVVFSLSDEKLQTYMRKNFMFDRNKRIF